VCNENEYPLQAGSSYDEACENSEEDFQPLDAECGVLIARMLERNKTLQVK
jgi:hypothetical protein